MVPILKAPAESFATDTETDKGSDSIADAVEKGGEGLWAGSSIGVVTAFQAKTGARVTWVGGVDVFSDEFANAEITPYVMRLCFLGTWLIVILGFALLVESHLATPSLVVISQLGHSRNH